ncbi:MAG: hypothetical protein ACRD1T_02065, partial [Acidimicrobiia bacterium]
LLEQIRQAVAILAGLAAVLALAYYLYPLIAKARNRSRRRAITREVGPKARIGAAYADWRDSTTDLGYRFPTDTPLMFLDRVMDDEEHIALAWLVTRTLWGDLSSEVTDHDAELAEDLSKSLIKRTSQAHPYTLRAIAAISRLSLRHPYAARVPGIERSRRFQSGDGERVRIAG